MFRYTYIVCLVYVSVDNMSMTFQLLPVSVNKYDQYQIKP